MRPGRRPIAAFALLGALAGCASEADRRQQAEQALESWRSTIHAVGEQWADGHVPAGYSRAALDRAGKEVQKQLAALPAGSESEPLRVRGRELVSEIERLSEAIQHDDAAAARAVPAR